MIEDIWDQQVKFKEILFFFPYTKVVLLFKVKHKPVNIFGFLKGLMYL